MSGTEIGPETFAAVDGAAVGFARDWQTRVDGRHRELWLMACLRATLDYWMTALIGAVPPGERDWGRLLDALGYDSSDPGLDAHQAEIEADIRELAEFGPPLGDRDADVSGQGF